AISMFVTPPDALSMTVLAVLMWMLFEVGLFFGRFLEKKEVEE
ncbi:MAG TPA: twin-arginine translocase subunit TatC, partial [Agitococcus sp.]|nr:twin-arginine translocase subunit TatC [Agitococcus sp.]